MNKTIAIDFDGVIHEYSAGWHDGSIYDRPVEASLVVIPRLMRSYCVAVFSTRSPVQIKEWFGKVAPEITCEIIPETEIFWSKRNVLGITNRKIAAIAYIDDRAIRFTNWKDVMNYFL